MILIFVALGLQGCGSPEKPNIPTVSQIATASVKSGFPGVSNDFKKFNPANEQDKTILKDIVSWLNESKIAKMEGSNRFVPTIGPTTLVLNLANGKQILIEPAIDSVTKHEGSKTIETGSYAKGFIDFQYGDSTKVFRLKSEPLDNWLLKSPWKD